MRLPILAASALLLLSFGSSAEAVDAHDAGPAGQLELADGRSARTQPTVVVGPPPTTRLAAWSALIADVGPRWSATWDRATSVPRRLYGEGVVAPGSVSNPDSAAAFARAFLARHIDLLAPGSRASDFLLVSNQERAGVRVVGFVQTHAGLRVQGGQVSFRFKNDRLVVVGSEALPDVRVDVSRARIAASAAEIVSSNWLLESASGVALEATGDLIILPVITNDRVLEYRTVVPVTLAAEQPLGKWDVYIDAGSGARVGRVQTLMFADGDVRYNAPVRQPAGARLDYAVPDTAVVVDGLDLLTNSDGSLTWSGDNPAALVTKTVGSIVDVVNQAGNDDTGTFTIAPDGSIVWDERNDELLDAQITTYVHTQIVKAFALTLAPDLDFIAEQQIANVNINDSCNAFSDGTTINFFQSSAQCANTARLPDVVYHEYGHSLHAHSIIEGVGFFNSAHSEGLSDFLAATITGDPAMGRGFFRSNAPLRHIDPSDKEHRWPDDVAGPHFTGLIFSGSMWDLRKMLIQKLGEAEGIAHTNKLWYATLERATDIPSTYIEVLLEDDDDGNLANGTPNGCDINAAFGPHGLRNLQIELSPLGAELPDAGGHPIGVTLAGLFAQCPGDQVEAVTLGWRLAGAESEDLEVVNLTDAGGEFTGTIPSPPEGSVVEYTINVALADLSSLTFPDNPADSLYTFYVGDTVELYCTDFSTDPFAEGWEHSAATGAPTQGDDWMWGTPNALPAAGDPPAAFIGDFIIGNDLGSETSNGRYSADSVNYAQSPVIDVMQYSDVRLQYRRWLTVEDAFYDRAAILVNGTLAWQNLNSDMGTSSSIHHQDREWRFQDVAISRLAVDKQVQVRFELSSDQGLEFGGWNIDDFCIVANTNSICGDGALTGAEDCDDGAGNSDTESNACRTDCRAATCGDGVVDDLEECDDGNEDSFDDCSNVCTLPESSGGCCQTDGGSHGGSTGALIVLVLALTWRRRAARGATAEARRAR